MMHAMNNQVFLSPLLCRQDMAFDPANFCALHVVLGTTVKVESDERHACCFW